MDERFPFACKYRDRSISVCVSPVQPPQVAKMDESSEPSNREPVSQPPRPAPWGSRPPSTQERTDAVVPERGGRHAAPRPDRSRFGVRAVVGVLGLVIAMIVVGVPLTRMIGAAQQTTARTDVEAPAPTSSTSPAAPGPVPTAVGNLLTNWSFEQDLSGWQRVGPANVTRELGGRTSGSCAFVQATSRTPARVGIVAPSVVPHARAGAAYEATAWVRSGTAGVRVVLTLVVTHGGKREASKTVTRTVSDPRWQRLDVGHRVTTSGELSVEVAVEGVSQGQGLLVDEVVVRQS